MPTSVGAWCFARLMISRHASIWSITNKQSSMVRQGYLGRLMNARLGGSRDYSIGCAPEWGVYLLPAAFGPIKVVRRGLEVADLFSSKFPGIARAVGAGPSHRE